jgi:hypothetical protein
MCENLVRSFHSSPCRVASSFLASVMISVLSKRLHRAIQLPNRLKRVGCGNKAGRWDRRPVGSNPQRALYETFKRKAIQKHEMSGVLYVLIGNNRLVVDLLFRIELNVLLATYSEVGVSIIFSQSN